MKKMISMLLAILLLAGLGSSAYAEDGQAPDYTTGTPWQCIDLQGVVTEDTPADLKDNFALYVNKDAILTLEIPEGYSSAGTYTDVSMVQEEDIKNMFLGDVPEGHDALLAYNLFKLMMDWDSRNALGVQPLKEQTDAIEAIDSTEALTAYFLNIPAEDEIASLWGAGSDVDFIDSSLHVLTVGSGCSLLLGDSAEYSSLTDYGAIKKEALSELARKMLMKLGYTEEAALQKIENCFAFETLVAPSIYTIEEEGNADYLSRSYNIFTRADLEQAQGPVPILECLEGNGYPAEDTYLVTNPAYLTRLAEVYTEENLPLIRDYLIVHGALNSASSLDRECYEWLYACSNAITGVTGMLDDETMFSAIVAETLEWPVAQLYTQTYLKQEDKERITELAEEYLDAYHAILQEADFFSEETRAKALEKLDAIDVRILYPDNWEKYECKELNFDGPEDGGTLWEANRCISRYFIEKNLKEHFEPVDKERWSMTPQTVNACYNPFDNSISILGAFARGAFYNSEMSDEEVYGKLGCFAIGHEISHAFDRAGAQFDKNGNMQNWWTEKDYETFQERNAKMEAYYDAMHPWEGQDFYGSIMTGEACADMAGMKVTLRIAADKENFDYDTFFRAVAEYYLTKGTLQLTYRYINDVHPLPYLRINATLQQFDEFLDFYGITEGDGMYLAPEDRVCIW